MARIQNCSDLLLLDTGSIMFLLFGPLSFVFLGLIGVGILFDVISNIVVGLFALSIVLAVDGFVLILLSRHTGPGA